MRYQVYEVTKGRHRNLMLVTAHLDEAQSFLEECREQLSPFRSYALVDEKEDVIEVLAPVPKGRAWLRQEAPLAAPKKRRNKRRLPKSQQ